MKSVLVIDKPNNCTECIIGKNSTQCPITGTMIDNTSIVNHDCPLSHLPEKRPCNYTIFEGYNNGYDKGWNDFRDTICKEGTVKH